MDFSNERNRSDTARLRDRSAGVSIGIITVMEQLGLGFRALALNLIYFMFLLGGTFLVIDKTGNGFFARLYASVLTVVVVPAVFWCGFRPLRNLIHGSVAQ